MLRIVSLAFIAAALGLALVGCGGGKEGFISTPTALAAFHQAGFTDLRVISNRTGYEQLARRQGRADPRAYAEKYALDQDIILPTGALGAIETAFGPLLAARLPSAEVAKGAYERGWSPDALRVQVEEARRKHPEVLPRGFELSKLRIVLVCNVLISSYNADSDATLDARVTRAAALLQERC